LQQKQELAVILLPGKGKGQAGPPPRLTGVLRALTKYGFTAYDLRHYYISIVSSLKPVHPNYQRRASNALFPFCGKFNSPLQKEKMKWIKHLNLKISPH
jgi:hypothetical protein